jgi:hypothetical protein
MHLAVLAAFQPPFQLHLQHSHHSDFRIALSFTISRTPLTTFTETSDSYNHYNHKRGIRSTTLSKGGGMESRWIMLRTQSTTSSITSSKSKVPQVNLTIRPARDPEKQGAHAKPSGDLVSCDQISNRSPDTPHVLSRDKSRDSIHFGWARSPLINKWQTVGTVHNQQRHVTLVIR